MKTIATAALAALTLAACVSDAPPPASGRTPTAAEQACLRDVTRTTNNPDVVLLGSEPTQGGTFVRVGVGAQRAPWQCIAYSDGRTGEIVSLTDEGAL